MPHRFCVLPTTSFQRPLRANHGKRVKFKSSRVSLEMPKRAWPKWPPNYEKLRTSWSPRSYSNTFDQQPSEAKVLSQSSARTIVDTFTLLTLSQWKELCSVHRKRIRKNDLCHQPQSNLGCSQQHARKCELSPLANYCKTPHSKRQRRLRSRVIVLGCWRQLTRVSRVQTRAQNFCRIVVKWLHCGS